MREVLPRAHGIAAAFDRDREAAARARADAGAGWKRARARTARVDCEEAHRELEPVGPQRIMRQRCVWRRRMCLCVGVWKDGGEAK